MGKEKEIFVIGHKNPDTDSICSALAYAGYKQKLDKTGQVYTAKRAGELNNETKFVLERFHVTPPELLKNVAPQVKDIDLREIPGVDEGISMKKAWTLMRDENISTLPVTQNNKLIGLITVKDLATSEMDIFDSRLLAKSSTTFANIVETLDGTMITGDPACCCKEGKLLIGAANPELLEQFIDPGDIVILANRYESQFCAIEMGASCLIVCMGVPITKTIQKLAEEKGCFIITTPHDTFTVARLICQSAPIRYFMTKENLAVFHSEELIEEAKEIMTKTRYRYFPVTDQNGNYMGMFSRRNYMDMDRKRVILVDHNEKSQAVDGLEQADILEIIDHHRLGSLETMQPVFFRNQPLGCTATIIYQMYQESGLSIEPNVAGLLCAAILSDTLMFRSPTCTQADQDAAQALAETAGIDIPSFAQEMFAAGSDLKEKTPEEIFYQDFKRFEAGNLSFAVGQINSMNQQDLDNIKDTLLPYMENVRRQQGFEMVFFMLTNIIEESTELLMEGPKAAETVLAAFQKEPNGHSVSLNGVVSRKKQLIPPILKALQQED